MTQYDPLALSYEELMGDKGDMPHQLLIDPLMFDLLPKDKNSNVLDVGCGNGYWAKILAQKYKNVVAIDSSKKLIKIATKKRSFANIEYRIVDIEEHLPFEDNSFNLIFSNMVLQYIKNIQNVVEELYRILNGKGSLLLSITHPTYELLKESSLRKRTIRTKYSTVTLGGKASLTMYYEPLNSFSQHFQNVGFSKVLQKDAIITEELAKHYPRYKGQVGIPRAVIFLFSKSSRF